MTMAAYGLGIDAGGTYTDAVILDMDSKEVICSSKALTTRNDLSIGIRNSLDGLDDAILRETSLVSLSSTLATNSVVEDKGCRIGLLCIGKEYDQDDTPSNYYSIDGKFDMSGREIEPLDEEYARNCILRMKDKVDSVAIAGYLSIRNPSHELKMRDMVESLLRVPAVCAHELSSELGFNQRTTTAMMNARLIPVIEELIDSVQKILGEFGITAPLMMVKGNGSLMNVSTALRKPVEMILSGPASSISGARTLTDVEDAMVIDIGGTTSDIGILRKGLPRLDKEGARIAGKRTRVNAVDVSTYGVGGDSRILVNGKHISLSAVRAIPLCVASDTWPVIRKTISKLSEITDDRSSEDFDLQDVIQDTEFFILAHNKSTDDLCDSDKRFLSLLADGPCRISDASKKLGIPTHAISIGDLESREFITRIGVTPTDILCAEGSYARYDPGVSMIAVGYLARKADVSLERFIQGMKDMVSRKIASYAAEKAFLDESGKETLDESERFLLKKALNGRQSGYSVKFVLNMPIIGMGASAGAWLPKVAELLGTDIILPRYSEIGNAVGAISGIVSETVSMTIRADIEGHEEDPACKVFTGSEVKTFHNLAEAREYVLNNGRTRALELALSSGAENPEVTVTENSDYIDIPGGRRILHECKMTFRATGKPSL